MFDCQELILPIFCTKKTKQDVEIPRRGQNYKVTYVQIEIDFSIDEKLGFDGTVVSILKRPFLLRFNLTNILFSHFHCGKLTNLVSILALHRSMEILRNRRFLKQIQNSFGHCLHDKW